MPAASGSALSSCRNLDDAADFQPVQRPESEPADHPAGAWHLSRYRPASTFCRVSHPTPVIYARGLVKRFGGISAVDGVHLDVQRGQLFGQR